MAPYRVSIFPAPNEDKFHPDIKTLLEKLAKHSDLDAKLHDDQAHYCFEKLDRRAWFTSEVHRLTEELLQNKNIDIEKPIVEEIDEEEGGYSNEKS
jgi:hypothetical protein